VLTGLELSTTGGWHIHAGFSCQTPASVFGHYMAADGITDPWLTPVPTRWYSEAAGVALIQSDVSQVSLYESQPVYGRALVVHLSSDAGSGRAGCGDKMFVSSPLPPPPPPSPPPAPPLNPGGEMVSRIVLNFTADATIESFDQEAFKQSLAQYLVIEPGRITLELVAGSIAVLATIDAPNATYAHAVTEALQAEPALEAKLNLDFAIQLESVSNPEAVALYPASGNSMMMMVGGVFVVLLVLAAGWMCKTGKCDDLPIWKKRDPISVGLERAIEKQAKQQSKKTTSDGKSNRMAGWISGPKKRLSRGLSGVRVKDQSEVVQLTDVSISSAPRPPPGPPPGPPPPLRPAPPQTPPPPTVPHQDMLAANQA